MSENDSQTVVEPPQPNRAPEPINRRRWFLPAVTGAAGLILGALLGAGTANLSHIATEAQEELEANEAVAEQEEAKASMFENVVDQCGADPDYATVSDGGETLTVDHSGDEDFGFGVSNTELWCIVDALDAPTSVVSHMEQTTSLDGRQTESWDEIEVSWSYHPDRGMDSVWTIVD